MTNRPAARRERGLADSSAFRLFSMLPPLLLFMLIATSWTITTLVLLGRMLVVSKEIDGVVFEANWASKLGAVFFMALLTAVIYPTLLSFYRAVFTPPGSVPAWYIQHYSALQRFWTDRHNEWLTGKMNNRARRLAAEEGEAGEGEDEEVEVRHRSGVSVLPTVASPSSSRNDRDSAHGDGEDATDETTALAVADDADDTDRAPPAPAEHSPEVREALAMLPPPFDLADSRVSNPGPYDPTWCRKCVSIRPPRAHHCGVCGRCVLVQDHHCPWVANCCGYDNYKYFYLLLVWGLMTSIVGSIVWTLLLTGLWMPYEPPAPTSASSGAASAGRVLLSQLGSLFVEKLPYPEGAVESFATTTTTMLRSTFRALQSGPPAPPPVLPSDKANAEFSVFSAQAGASYLIAFVICVALGFALVMFVAMHTFLIVNARTTLEAAVMEGANRYTKGSAYENWVLIMGRDPKYWFWPVQTRDSQRATAFGTFWGRDAATGRHPSAPWDRVDTTAPEHSFAVPVGAAMPTLMGRMEERAREVVAASS